MIMHIFPVMKNEIHDNKNISVGLYLRLPLGYRSTFSQSFRAVVFIMNFLCYLLQVLHVSATKEKHSAVYLN